MRSALCGGIGLSLQTTPFPEFFALLTGTCVSNGVIHLYPSLAPNTAGKDNSAECLPVWRWSIRMLRIPCMWVHDVNLFERSVELPYDAFCGLCRRVDELLCVYM